MPNLEANTLKELKEIIEELPSDAQARIQKYVIAISNNINNIGKHYAFGVLFIMTQYAEANSASSQEIRKTLEGLSGIDKVETDKYKDELNAMIKKHGNEYQYAIMIAATFMKNN